MLGSEHGKEFIFHSGLFTNNLIIKLFLCDCEHATSHHFKPDSVISSLVCELKHVDSGKAKLVVRVKMLHYPYAQR